MRVIVVVGFVDKNWHTRPKGSVADLDEAYATTLVEQGYVVVEDVPAQDDIVSEVEASTGEEIKPTKRKASKRNARKKV